MMVFSYKKTKNTAGTRINRFVAHCFLCPLCVKLVGLLFKKYFLYEEDFNSDCIFSAYIPQFSR